MLEAVEVRSLTGRFIACSWETTMVKRNQITVGPANDPALLDATANIVRPAGSTAFAKEATAIVVNNFSQINLIIPAALHARAD
jgi:hypothetical protein